MAAKAYSTPPRNRESLSARIRNLATERKTTEFRLRGTIGNIVIGQMLPSGAVKGGTAMALRHGQSRTRFSPDVDVTRAGEVGVDAYVAAFRANLERGWHGFAGVIVTLEPATPAGVPSAYVMSPFTPVAVLPLDHQIAQKLHACSAPGSDRAHDLVDLQLLARGTELDMALTASTTRRLFAARKGHAWPPVLTISEGWAFLYEEAADGIDVLPTVAEAVAWVNGFVSSLDRG